MQNLLAKYFSDKISDIEKRLLFSEIEKNPALKDEFIQMQNLEGLVALSANNTPDEWAAKKLDRFYAGILQDNHRRCLL